MLGLGGGSVARIARALAPEAEIVGVELDRDVIRLARQHFDLDTLGLKIEIADARKWLEKHDPRGSQARTGTDRFDAILEDVFVGEGDDVHKPDWIPDPAHRIAKALLAPGGILVSNTLDEKARITKVMRAQFASVVSIEVEDYDNRVLVAGGPRLSGASLRGRVADSPILAESLPIMNFRTR